MRATVAFLMLLLLLATPITHVLAQAAQQQDTAPQPQPAVVATAVVADAARVQRVIIGVPDFDPHGSAALLLAPAALDLTPARNSLPPLMLTPTPMSKGAKIGLIAVGVVILVGILLFVPCWECLGD